MAFFINTFTDNGLELLSKLSATAPLVIDKVIPLNQSTTEYNFRRNPVSWFENIEETNVTASIVSAGGDPDSDTKGRIVINLKVNSAITNNVNVYGLVVIAHTDIAGTTSTPVTFFACGTDVNDPNDVLVIPYNANIPVGINVAITFSCSHSTQITTGDSAPNYLLADEVSRFVTTHAMSGATQGDSQVIYGEKRLRNKLMLDGNEGGNLEFWYDSDPCVSITQSNEFGLVFDITHADFDPDVDGDLYEFRADGRELCTIGVKDGAGNLTGLEYASARYISCGSIEALDANKIYIDSDFVPGDATVSLGNGVEKFASIGAEKVMTNTLSSADAAAITVVESLIPSIWGTQNLGNSTNIWGEVHAESYFEGANAGHLLKETSLTGSVINVPIGGLIVLYVPTKSSGTIYRPCETFVINSGDTVRPARVSSTNGQVQSDTSFTVQSGTYKCLIGADPHTPVLVMRVA